MSLVRRAARGPSAAPESCTIGEIESWLLGEAIREDDFLSLAESLIWREVAAGLPLDRASFHVGTLHPQVYGFAWNWTRSDGLFDEVRVGEAVLSTDSYKRNPIFRVNEHGESFRAKTGDPAVAGEFPLMAELAAQGITEYIALPLGASGT